jgi:hypothetical protein
VTKRQLRQIEAEMRTREFRKTGLGYYSFSFYFSKINKALLDIGI